MPNIDPVPLPYGPLQYYQVHYIVQVQSKENDKFLARCKPVTKGHFSSKRIVDVKWIGNDKFAEVLQANTGLTEMLKEVMEKAGEKTVDPEESQIRIFGRWVHEEYVAFNPTMLEIADRIALYIKNKLHGDRR
jgi:hypothetical protein